PGGDVCAPTSGASSRDAEEVVAEERGEEVGEPAEVEGRGAEPAAAEARMTEPVVELAPLCTREDLVRLDDLAETLFRVRRVRDVRMELARQPTEGALDVLGPRVAGDAEQLIVVALRRGHLRLRLRCHRQDVRASPARPSELTSRSIRIAHANASNQ